MTALVWQRPIANGTGKKYHLINAGTPLCGTRITTGLTWAATAHRTADRNTRMREMPKQEQRRRQRVTKTVCPAVLTLDFDAIYCEREAGHTGLHRDHGEGGAFAWKSLDNNEGDKS